jgi:hypothetical protein
MNNLMVYKSWGLGYIEEVLNGDVYLPGGVCSHQCWSETMAIQPVIEGMLGFMPNAMEGMITLGPNIPPLWDSLEVRNLRCGNSSVSFRMIKEGSRVSYKFHHEGPGEMTIDFAPYLMPGTVILSLDVDGAESMEPVLEKGPRFTRVRKKLTFSENLLIEMKTKGGISILPVIPDPAPGDTTIRMKIIDHYLEDNIYTVTMEGLYGTTDSFELWYNGYDLVEHDNCSIINQKDGKADVSVEFNEPGATLVRKKVSFRIE